MDENKTETPPEAQPPAANPPPPPPPAPSPEAIALQAARDELETKDRTVSELRAINEHMEGRLKAAQADREVQYRAVADLRGKHDALAAQLAIAPLGYCPVCGKPGHSRTDGQDRCHSGHDYPSVTALHAPLPAWNPGLPTTDTALRIENDRLRKEVRDLIAGVALAELRTQLADKDRELIKARQEADRATQSAVRLKVQLLEHFAEIRRLKGESSPKPVEEKPVS